MKLGTPPIEAGNTGFSRPFGTGPLQNMVPTLKRWAILRCPFGTIRSGTVLSELLVTERGYVEDQPQQPDCRIKSSLPNPLCDGKLLRLASEAQPRSVANNTEMHRLRHAVVFRS